MAKAPLAPPASRSLCLDVQTTSHNYTCKEFMATTEENFLVAVGLKGFNVNGGETIFCCKTADGLMLLQPTLSKRTPQPA